MSGPLAGIRVIDLTSAPMSPRICVATGPSTADVKSTTRMSVSGPDICGDPSHNLASAEMRIELARTQPPTLDPRHRNAQAPERL